MRVLSDSERFDPECMSLWTFIYTWFLYAITIWSDIYNLISWPFIRNQLWCLGRLNNPSLFTDLLNSIFHRVPVLDVFFLIVFITDLVQLRLPWVLSSACFTRHFGDHSLSLLRCELQQIFFDLFSPLSVSLNSTQHHQLVIWMQLQKILFLRSVSWSSIIWQR